MDININQQIPLTVGFEVMPFIELVLKLKRIHQGSIEFNFTDNAFITELNRNYLKKDCPTDVITFNLGTPEEIIGDVYISYEQAKLNATQFHNSIDNEIKLLIVHSILHLLDYKDYTKADQAIMEQEQTRLLTLAQKKENTLRFRKRSLLDSFKVAFRGVGFVIYSQRNMKIHLFLGSVAILIAIMLRISSLTKWLALLISIALVLITEAMNTAVEVSVDLTTKKRKFRAMMSKDIAAGAVLIAAINAIIIGSIIFYSELF